MYNQNKILLYVLLTLFAMELIIETVIITIISIRIESAFITRSLFYWISREPSSVVFQLPPPFVGCFPNNTVTWAWAYWIPITVFDSILFLLASYKSIEFSVYHGKNMPRLSQVLIRDSVIFFGGVLALILINLVIWSLHKVRISICDVGRSNWTPNGLQPGLFNAFPSFVFPYA